MAIVSILVVTVVVATLALAVARLGLAFTLSIAGSATRTRLERRTA